MNKKEKSFDKSSLLELESCGFLQVCSCPYCDATKYVRYSISYRIKKTKYFVFIKTINDKTLISFWNGCYWGEGIQTTGDEVVNNLLEDGVEEVLYHLDLFRS